MTDEIDVDELAAVLFESLRSMVHAARIARPEAGLSAAEMSALQNLKRAGESTSASLARVEGITPQAMGATLAALEARGLIQRDRDPDDGRRILLRLTDAARAVLDARRAGRAAGMARTLAAEFTPAELRTLAAAAPLLERVTRRLA